MKSLRFLAATWLFCALFAVGTQSASAFSLSDELSKLQQTLQNIQGIFSSAASRENQVGQVIGSTSLTGTTATTAPSLTLSVTPASISVGSKAVITWTSSNVTTCTASGAWTGTKLRSGTISTGIFAVVGNRNYTLTCTGANGSITRTVALSVTASSTPGSSVSCPVYQIPRCAAGEVVVSGGTGSNGCQLAPRCETATSTSGTSVSTSYSLSDVKSVTKRSVDPIPTAVDDEYTLFTITLNSGTVHEVRACGFCTTTMREQAFRNTGYTGDVAALMAMAVETPTSCPVYQIPRCATGQVVVPGGVGANGCQLAPRCETATSTPGTSVTVPALNFTVRAVGLTATTSFSLNNGCLGYEIDWGDGKKDSFFGGNGPMCTMAVTAVNKAHTYNQGGTYTVKVTPYYGTTAGTAQSKSVSITGPGTSTSGTRVVTTNSIYVRSAPNGSILGTKAAGSLGTRSTAAPVTAGSYEWVYVNFDTNPDGYVASRYLSTNLPGTTPTVGGMTREQIIARLQELQAEVARLQAMLLQL